MAQWARLIGGGLRVIHRSTLAGESRLEYVLPSLSCNIRPYAAGGRRLVKKSAKSQLHRKMMPPCPVLIPLVAAFSFRCQLGMRPGGDSRVCFRASQPDNMLIKTRGSSLVHPPSPVQRLSETSIPHPHQQSTAAHQAGSPFSHTRLL